MPQHRKIPVCAPLIGNREIELVTECIKSSWISSAGPYVPRFESRFSRFCHSRYGVATNSGTTALHLALAALRVGDGDEVNVPTFTMIASINAVEYTGARTVLVDADRETWTMDVRRLERKVSRRTKAIMPVHIYGHPTDMDPILDLAEKHDLAVIEDAAEAHGAKYKGRMVGSIGDVASFSFYSNKIITTGEGGMNTTDDKELADRMRWLRAHAFGRAGKHFWHEELGYGYRMSGLQASFGLAQMEKAQDMVRLRIGHARLYNELLGELGTRYVTLPPEESWAKNVYWMYSIRVRNLAERNRLMSYLRAKGIETRTFFYPIHSQPYYRNRYSWESFPVADELSSTGLNLPSGNGLTDNEIQFVCDRIKDFFKSSGNR